MDLGVFLILSFEDPLVPRPHQFLIVPEDIPCEGSKVQICFRQTLHPICLLPLGPALIAGREAGRQDYRAAKVPQLLSHHPHGAAL